jgi:Flp pilus assembly protein TadB
MSVAFVAVGSAIGLAASGSIALYRSSQRTALDVAGDLGLAKAALQSPKKKISNSTDSIGKSDARTEQKQQAYALLLTAVVLVIYVLVATATFGSLLLVGGTTLFVSLVALRRGVQGRQAKAIREIEFYLPIIMERVVMAVQSGFDILGSIRVVLEYEEQRRINAVVKDEEAVDPVTDLLGVVCRLAEAGRGLEESLNEVAEKVDCPSLRHAFIHLALAHKEGGELVMPLRELSDATQLYYQESIEEEIAKLPVKATMPLLLTFAGLIIFFLIPPLIQVMDMTSKALPK